MSGRQAKLTRREIRRSAEPSVRLMQQQQEAAIKSAIQRCNELTTMHDLLSAKVEYLLRHGRDVTQFPIADPQADGDSRPLVESAEATQHYAGVSAESLDAS